MKIFPFITIIAITEIDIVSLTAFGVLMCKVIDILFLKKKSHKYKFSLFYLNKIQSAAKLFALEVIRVKKLMPNGVPLNKYFSNYDL